VCDAALAAKSSKPISQAKKHCQDRISHMQAQTKRKILVRVVYKGLAPPAQSAVYIHVRLRAALT
jgi:hypothetical protein